MASLLIVAHFPLASSLQAVARHAYPDCSQRLAAVDIPENSSLAEAETTIRAALVGLAPSEVLILADVFGATPCNAAVAAADGTMTRVVAGVSVPMLWRVLCYADCALDDLVIRAVAGAAQGALHVAIPRQQNQPVPPGKHDQVKHHHQQ